MKYMGLDIGDKTIGIAFSEGIIAQGFETYMRKNVEQDCEYLLNLVNKEKVDKIIVGLPKNMNGSMGFQSEKVIDFCEKMKKVVNKDIELIDERLTTVLANNFMLQGDLSRKKRKKIIDKVAAEIILQDFLDRKNKDYINK